MRTSPSARKSSLSSRSSSVLSESGRLPINLRRRSTSTGSKSSMVASDTASLEKSSLPSLVAISKGYMGMFSGVPSTRMTLFKMRPSEVAPTTLPFGIMILSTSTPETETSSASTRMGGIVLFAKKADRPIGSACLGLRPVGFPSSSTPRYRTPPSELNMATVALTRMSSSIPCFAAFPEVSLLNSTVRLSFKGISMLGSRSRFLTK